jgi:sterol desaturase/sphingolipid hydroxylase (fatty acid hydroxylase superfamily)
MVLRVTSPFEGILFSLPLSLVVLFYLLSTLSCFNIFREMLLVLAKMVHFNILHFSIDRHQECQRTMPSINQHCNTHHAIYSNIIS